MSLNTYNIWIRYHEQYWHECNAIFSTGQLPKESDLEELTDDASICLLKETP